MARDGSRYKLSRELLKPAAFVRGIGMQTLIELKSRHEMRKQLNAPMDKILGPDAAAADMDAALEMLETSRQLLREAITYIEQTTQAHDDLTNDLLARMTEACE